MIVLLSDFGIGSPYVAQMQAVLLEHAPSVPHLVLFSDLPVFQPDLASPLLEAYQSYFAAASIFLCVVDPGVGSLRKALLVQADTHYFIGPDNGLFDHVVAASKKVHAWQIPYLDTQVSASFHGRDVFAPVAASLASGTCRFTDWPLHHYQLQPFWQQQLCQVVYIDRYGNAMTGIRAATVPNDSCIVVREQRIGYARTFNDVEPGQAFWYENSIGLLEIAINQGHAAQGFNLVPGQPVLISPQ